MSDTTLSLAARLAANLIVDAIKLAKPGARLAGKIGDRLLGGSPFSEREAQRFLTMGGSERLNKAEAEREVWEPGELSGTSAFRAGGMTFETGPRPTLSTPRHHNTMPNWQAPQSSAPVAPKPTDVAGSPGSASAPPWPGADSGHLNQPVGVGVAEPGTGEAEAEHSRQWLIRNRSEHIRQLCASSKAFDTYGSDRWFLADSILNILNGALDRQDALKK